jgi:hypothetical protein|tara:strand:+ start:681 stop:1004 length:324 start_codon:yes stop_codon:yes gene_type:complete
LNKEDLETSKHIEHQVARWDIFAKIAPTFFLIISALLLSWGTLTFQTLFNIGMILFAFTAVTWWFWTIYTVRFVIRSYSIAVQSLIEVKTELRDVQQDLRKEIEENK